MSFSSPQLAIILIAALHLLFAVGELFPWASRPLILQKVLEKKPNLSFGADELRLVAMIVHNAGVYNAIVAAGLLATLWVGPVAQSIQIVWLIGGIVAGVFGAFTLSKVVLLQAVLGIAALMILLTA